jgi:hypothetical protein
MEDDALANSSFSATINAPIEKVDIASWCFTLPEAEYQSCSPAYCSAGATTTPDRRRMSINVEITGWKPDGAALHRGDWPTESPETGFQLRCFTPTGRTKIGVIWDLSVKKIDDKTCEFINTVHSSATPELMDFLGKQGIPLFAKSIERHVLKAKVI